MRMPMPYYTHYRNDISGAGSFSKSTNRLRRVTPTTTTTKSFEIRQDCILKIVLLQQEPEGRDASLFSADMWICLLHLNVYVRL